MSITGINPALLSSLNWTTNSYGTSANSSAVSGTSTASASAGMNELVQALLQTL